MLPPVLPRLLAIASGPIAFFALLLWAPAVFEGDARLTLAVTAWVACWWVFEALPIPVTSLLPVALLPGLGLASAKEVAGYYMNDLLMLLLGGFILALTIERWGLHRRVALAVLSKVGTSPRRLTVGFLLAAAVLSMWISNTATALMLLPIGLAVTSRLSAADETRGGRRLDIALLLAIAYGANIGGTGTYIGTPPNLIFRERYRADFGAGADGPPELSFLHWTLAFAPMALLFLGVIAVVLSWRLPKGRSDAAAAILRDEARRLPRWSVGEGAVAVLFGVTALLWITRKPIRVGDGEYLGWTRLLPDGFEVSDGTVAIAMVLVSFLVWVPRRPDADRHPPAAARLPSGGVLRPPSDAAHQGRTSWAPLLTWRDVEQRVPWGILLLYGGGFSLGQTFHTSGLSVTLGDTLSGGIATWPSWMVVGSICLLMTFLTEVTSNTASTNVVLPILSAVALDLDMDGLLLLLPATLSASCAFMLPVATPTNAVVFSSGRIPIRSMVTTGFVLNLLAVLWVSAWLHWIALPFFSTL